MTIIARDTFSPTSAPEATTFGVTKTVGTIEVSLRGETRTVEAIRWEYTDGRVDFFVYGAFTGRYVSGGKAWPASVSTSARGEQVSFGRDDRSGKFNKANGLFWRSPA